MASYRWILPGEDIADAFFVRQTVFVEEQGFALETERDATDPVAHHLVWYDAAGMPVACGRIFPDHNEPSKWIVGRVAVTLPVRGTGLGRLLMEEMECKAAELGAKQLQLGAQIQASGFYTALGFDVFGEPYFDEHCEHVYMCKQL